ncbi:MAG: type II toxin-antitoxin system prevent-host-death family antitoxin [Brachymonas sp.]|nr:type II toxin-antitoxin system prevent-host-death family antitoxin [Brachymonas sp.]
MQTFSIRDLRDRSGELTREAELGHLSLVTKHGEPLFVTVPFGDKLIEHGVNVALATSLFKTGDLSLGQAKSLAGMNHYEFMEHLGQLKIPVINYSVDDLKQELDSLDRRLDPT